MTKYFSGVAAETLQNNTICVKDGEQIRNIRDAYDLETSLLVFASNVGDEYEIQPNIPVRYAVVNLSFR